MMQATMLASSHYLQPVTGTSLPSLREALAVACGTAFRRVDRFAQLALLGSARCVQGQDLDPLCGIYIASALGPVASNIRVQEQTLRDGEWPKPFDFINTLGGSAGFYVASNLGLAGPDWFMGDRHPLLTAIDMALTDLAAGAVPQALVGVVEELPLPQAAHRRRLDVAADTVLAEGSHWWLLGEAAQHGGTGRLLELVDCVDRQALGAWLTTHGASVTRAALGRDLDPADAQMTRNTWAHVEDLQASTLPFHASLEAAWFADGCGRDASGPLVLVADGQLLHLGT